MVNISIISYRKISFANKFGFTVRDLMILKELEELTSVNSISWLERPSLPHEILMEIMGKSHDISKKTVINKNIDYNYLSALKDGRLRSIYSFSKHWPVLQDTVRAGGKSILLDFHPFVIPPAEIIQNTYYWYDLIDNFTKHNRFSIREKEAVKRKYDFVSRHANLVTGVSRDAVSPFGGVVLPNKLVEKDFIEVQGSPTYDIGFLGFLTDKFDINFIHNLASSGLKIIIFGHSYNKDVLEKIKENPNITYGGPFNSKDAPAIISKFKIGIIPYIPSLSHDESPIKFFQYVACGRPVILSKKFDDIESVYGDKVHYYDPMSASKTIEFVNTVSNNFEKISAEVKEVSRNKGQVFWQSDIKNIIRSITSDIN